MGRVFFAIKSVCLCVVLVILLTLLISCGTSKSAPKSEPAGNKIAYAHASRVKAKFPAFQIISGAWANVSSGGYHNCAIAENGTLWCWGWNASGQLGNGSTADEYSPKQTGVWTDWKSVSAGALHTCGKRENGTLWCFGDNRYGQLGDGTKEGKRIPTRVGTDNNWSSVSSGRAHTCARKSDGTLWCWGANESGQLGDGTTIDRYYPVPVGKSKDWVSVSAGGNHTCGKKSDGTIFCWGDNSRGQLGFGTTTDWLIPKKVGNRGNWSSVSAGLYHTCAKKKTGTLWCWGANDFGQLGDGTSADRLSPVKVGIATNWASVSSGAFHTCAKKTNDTLWCFGRNDNGQLGDGTTADKRNPVRAGTGSDWSKVKAGYRNTCAIRKNGKLECFGANGSELANHPPIVAQAFSAVFTDEDIPVSVSDISSHFRDADNDALSFSVSGFGAVIAIMNGDTIELSAPLNWNGTETGSVLACDWFYCVSTPLEVTFNPVNDAPVFYNTLLDDSVNEDNVYRLNLAEHITDVDGDTLTVFINTNPTVQVEFSGGSNVVNLNDADTTDDFVLFTPPLNFNGEVNIEISATDPFSEQCQDSFVLNVVPVNDIPVITDITISRAQEKDYLLGQAFALDADTGSCGRVSFYNVLPGATLTANNVNVYVDPVTGRLSSFPLILPDGTRGTNSLELVVRDGCGAEARLVKLFNVAPAPDPVPPPSLPLADEFSPAPRTGTNRILVILANYSDTAPTFSPQDFAQLLFGTTSGSMRDYYRTVSYGKLDLSGDVVGWVQLSQPASYYGENRDSFKYPQNLYKLTEEAITLAEAEGVDFSRYDNNNDGWVDSLIIVHQGLGEQMFVNPLSQGGSHPLYFDNVKIEHFAMLTELVKAPPDPKIRPMGFFAHEYGHLLGMIDLYHWYYINTNTNIRPGIGRYDLMAYGNYGGIGGSASQPIEISAFHKALLGWLEPVVVNSDTTIFISPLETNAFAVKIPFGADNREYFLLSNQQRLGYDEKLPAKGLFIWHIDESAFLQNAAIAPQETCGTDHKYFHPRVALEQADGLFELDKALDTGDDQDSYAPGAVFSSSSVPNNYSYDCFPSGVEVRAISDTVSGGTVEIKFNRFQTTSSAPSVWLRESKFEPIAGKADADAFPEPGEELELLVRLMNTGTLAESVSLQVGTTSPYLQLGNTVLSAYPDLGTGDSAYNSTRFRVKVLSIGQAEETPANLKLTLTANSGAYSWIKTVGITIGKPAVLVVDDDGGAKAEDAIIDALNYLNYVWGAFSYSKWEISKQGLPSLELLQNHQAVIWLTGPVVNNPLDSAELNLIKSYLDLGGKLILSSQYLLINPSQEVSDFAHQYLNLAGFEDANYSVMFIHGLSQNPISHTTRSQTNLQTRKLYSIHYYPIVPRNVSLKPSAGTLTAFTNDLGNPVMTQYSPSNSYGVIFSSFGLEHLDRTVLAFYSEGSLMRRLLNAVKYKSSQPVIFDCAPVSARPRTKAQTLTLTGLNFQPDTEFSFPDGNILLVSKTYNSATSYTITVNVLYNAHPGYHKIATRNSSNQEWAVYDRYFKVEGSANANHKPIATASVDPVRGPQGGTFRLSGLESYDEDNEPLYYQWTQTFGPIVELQPSATAGQVLFQSPPDYIGEFEFSLRVSDGTTLSDADTVRMKAGNHTPVAILTAEPISGNRFQTYTLDGSQSYDLEGEPLTYFWTQLEGATVSLSDGLTPGVKRFNPAMNYIGDYVFELKVFDGLNLSDGDTVRITVTKLKPVASAEVEPLIGNRNTAFFLLDATQSYDPEGGTIVGYSWTQLSGPPVNLVPDNQSAQVRFQPVGLGEYLFSLVVSDGFTLSEADTVRAIVENNAPSAVATAIPPLGNLNTPLFLLSASDSSDPDGDSLSYLWTQISGPVVLPGSTTSEQWSFTPTEEGDYVFLLEVSDGLLADTVSVTVDVENHPPVALASADPPEGCRKTPLFTLSALGSYDPDGDQITYYLWTQVEGATVELSPGATAPEVSFSPRQDYEGWYGFELEVSDGALSDTTTLRIYVANHPPIARASANPESGNHHIPFFNLSASLSSDQDGDTLSYQWTQIEGPNVQLSPGSTAQQVSFPPVIDYLGQYIFSLSVSDGLLDDSTIVSVTVYNNPPSALAGATPLNGTRQTPSFNLSALLSSDLDGDTLTYQWTQQQGATVTLLPDASSGEVSFVPRQDYAGIYEFELSVFDGFTTDTDTTQVTVNNNPPLADASADPLSGTRQTLFTLSGLLSHDPDQDSLTYEWTQLSGLPVSLIPSSTAGEVNFSPNPDYEGVYLFSLNVSDGLLSDSDTISVNVLNNPPVALLAGSTESGIVNQTIVIDGSLSYDPDSDPIQYIWTQISGPEVSLDLTDPSMPFFIPAEVGIYVFQLQTFDGLEYSAQTPQIEIIITVENNHLPVADAGDDLIADSRDLNQVCLDGTGSYDPDQGDTITAYSWQLLSKPQGSSAVLTGVNTAYPCFFDDKPGDYLLSLRVADFQNAWSFPDEISIYSKTDDLDGDLMSDEFELEYGLNPRAPADGSLIESSTTDPDGDHLVNVHEYFNSTNPRFAEQWLLTVYNLSKPWQSGFFADADGDLLFGATDATALSALLASGGTDTSGYASIYPPNGDTHDLDGDGAITSNDLTILNELISGNSANFTGVPDFINLIQPATGETTVKIGKTAKIVVEVKDADGTPRSGVAVIFEVQKGDASLYGGEGATPEKRLLEQVSGINTSDTEFAPALTQDGLEIFYTSVNIYPGGTSSQDIFRATRSSIDEPFGVPEPLPRPLNSSTNAEAGASLTGDGLYLFFYRYIYDSRCYKKMNKLYYSHRTARDQPFSEVAEITELNNSVTCDRNGNLSPWISPDGLTIYFVSDRLTSWGWDIWKATRESMSNPFSSPTRVYELNLNSNTAELYPSLTADQLEVVFLSNRSAPGGDTSYNFWFSTRARITDNFSTPYSLELVNSSRAEWSPFITLNGLDLYYSTDLYSFGNFDIYHLRRPSRSLSFYINQNPGRFDITGAIAEGTDPNSGGKAFIYVKPNATGDIKVVVSVNQDIKRNLPDLGLSQIITIHATQ